MRGYDNRLSRTLRALISVSLTATTILSVRVCMYILYVYVYLFIYIGISIKSRVSPVRRILRVLFCCVLVVIIQLHIRVSPACTYICYTIARTQSRVLCECVFMWVIGTREACIYIVTFVSQPSRLEALTI